MVMAFWVGGVSFVETYGVEWGSRGGTKAVCGTHGCGLWKGIRMGWDKLALHIEMVVGNGGIGLGNIHRIFEILSLYA
jgi:hypothetical protein